MFGFFRQPSAYAVAIRDSMIREPEKWRHEHGVFDVLKKDGIVVWCEFDKVGQPFTHPSEADRRCIREGVEAWIAWSVSNQKAKVCDA